jgi:hypothetical protein
MEGHVARMSEKLNAYKIFVGQHWVDQNVGRWIILKWT